MEYLNSMYIDDELDLDDKISFVDKIRADSGFADEAVELLHQEKIIRSDAVYQTPLVRIEATRDWRRIVVSLLRPVGFAVTGFAAALLLTFYFAPTQKDYRTSNRFLIYNPYAKQAEIAGTFTDWKKLPLKKIGSSGYWEIILKLDRGEHRFTYILEGRNRIADPTILTREKDDFGGENSIIHVDGKV